MRKVFISVLSIILLLCSWAPVLATTLPPIKALPLDDTVSVEVPPTDTMRIAPDYPPPSVPSGLYELVVFDKRGGAQVGGKIVLDKRDKLHFNTFSFVIPGRDITFVNAVWEKWTYASSCYNGKYPRPLPLNMQESRVNFEDEPKDMPIDPGVMPPADQYCPPNYTQTYTSIEPNVQPVKNGTKVTFSLSAKQDKTQESLLFLFRTSEYTRKTLSNYYYNFDTVKVPLTVDSVQVGITVKDGLKLRGTQISSYGYPTGFGSNFKALENATDLSNEKDQELSNVSNEISYQGMLRKSDSDMTPDSSLTVSGVYGTNIFALYMKEIFLGILLVVGIIGGIVWAIKRFFKNNLHLKTIIITTIVTIVISVFLIAFILLLFFYLRTTGFGIQPGY